MTLLLAMALSGAHASEISGDIAVTYGRNFGQGLNVAGLVGEVKTSVHPQVAVGARIGGVMGAGLGTSGARGYLGLPLLLKGEGFLSTERNRPFLGLGAGVTSVVAAGAVLTPTDLEAAAYGVTGLMPTLLPELGVDLGGLRLSVSHSILLGSARGIAGQLAASGVSVGDEYIPGLSGTSLQIGGHFGGPKPERETLARTR